jgi:hypothetical protein
VNEQLAAVITQSSYTDPVTLGPEPGVMAGLDLTVQAADVYAQFARSVATGVQPWDDREYLLHPGARSVENVCGARFRSAVAAVPAIVTASLRGPDSPQIGQIFDSQPLVGPALLLPQPLKLVQIPTPPFDGLAAVFNGVPPSGYTGVLVYLTTANPVWLVVTSLLADVNGNLRALSQRIFVPANGTFYGVLGVAASQLAITLANGVVGDTPTVGVWPTNLPPGVYNLPPSEVLLNLHPSTAIANGGSQSVDLAAYFGTAHFHFLNLNAGPWLVIVSSSDSAGAFLGERARFVIPAAAGAVNGVLDFDVRLAPGRNQLGLFNQSGIAGNTSLFDVTVTGQSAGLVTP